MGNEMFDSKKFEITHSPEYKEYLAALCRLASGYVPKIRRQFAEKAFEKYSDPTLRRLVLEYGKEAKKLDASRLSDFELVAENPELYGHGLEDSCLNKAGSYGDAIKLFFLDK